MAKIVTITNPLTGQPAQVDQLDHTAQQIDDGLNIARNVSNPNLLDNWYFGNPVNQRGQTSYTGTGYGIDRWIRYGGDTLLNDGYITLLGYGNNLDQSADKDVYKQLRGKTVTMSVLGRGNFSIVSEDYANNFLYASLQSAEFTIVRLTLAVRSDADRFVFHIQPHDGNPCDIIAVKLELGSQQTLAHQDANGNWVLNEIPDYGEQLARCQRYFRRIKAKQVYSSGSTFAFPIVDVGGATWANINVILSMMMRDAKPSVSFHGLSVIDYISNQSRGSISDNAERNVIYYTGDTVKLSINTGITLTDTDIIMMASDGYIDIINNL